MKKDSSRAANYLLLAFGGLSLVLLSLPMTGKVRTFQACVAYLLNPLPYYGSQAVRRLAELPEDAARLISGDIELVRARRELQETAFLRAEVESLRVENERLAAALGMRPRGEQVLLWARVMKRDPLNWHRSIVVDAGSEQGVTINAPVLAIHGSTVGVVGRVIEVHPWGAKVLLLTDDLSAVAGYLPGSGWEGLIQGQGSWRLRMNYLPLEADLAIGQRVHSSATSATFPSDILIGTVSRIFERDPFLAFQSVEVEPAIQASRLQEVMILTPKGSGRS